MFTVWRDQLTTGSGLPGKFLFTPLRQNIAGKVTARTGVWFYFVPPNCGQSAFIATAERILEQAEASAVLFLPKK